ncbi:MAG TPA: tetratricopeptide repeat protein [Bryobacteraceae bacterium]|nr:tetratricopeptide repeat protein [Bryobacteraceae bacterium]HOQ45986.1 tetratricopeptide repeat protein [Bryobacteraceae bacterium]HPQ13595.1 tetratricopeptide repeat protein [Bryobacteraceae bacterium]HPU73803.1 tetratricopeptide repeat protein [Bryobacteraceae bacterium]
MGLRLAVGALACLMPVLCRAGGSDPKKAFEHYRRASDLYVQKQFQAAAEELERSLKLDKQVRPAKLLGLCRQLLGDLEGAVEAFRLATRLAPKDAEAWFFLGRVYWIQNFFDSARDALLTSVRLDSNDFRSRECLALTFEALGDFDRALAEYRAAVKLNDRRPQPSNTPPLNYGAFLLKTGDLAESEAQLKRARSLKPDDWQARFELGKLYSRTGKLTEARDELLAAAAAGTAQQEDRARILRLLATIHARLGETGAAQQALREAEKQ